MLLKLRHSPFRDFTGVFSIVNKKNLTFEVVVSFSFLDVFHKQIESFIAVASLVWNIQKPLSSFYIKPSTSPLSLNYNKV